MFLDHEQWQEDLGLWTWRNLPDFLRSALDAILLWSPIPLFRSFLDIVVGCSLGIPPYIALGDRNSGYPSTYGLRGSLHRLSSVGILSLDGLFMEGSVLSNNPVIQLYPGPLHAETWRLAIFLPETTAHRI